LTCRFRPSRRTSRNVTGTLRTAAAIADLLSEVVSSAQSLSRTIGAPLRGIRNVAGPDVFPLDELGKVTLAARQDNRTVITDDRAGTFAGVTGDVLTAGPDAHLAATHYRDWIQTAR
jgi:hypothetical protein